MSKRPDKINNLRQRSAGRKEGRLKTKSLGGSKGKEDVAGGGGGGWGGVEPITQMEKRRSG